MILRKKRFYAYALLSAVLLFLAYAAYRVRPYYRNQLSDEELRERFAALERDDISLGYLQSSSRELRYVQIGEDPAKPLLVFIHGSPSSSAFWVEMMKDSSLQQRANLLAIDRPGYGGSGLGRAMVSVREQAENVVNVIKSRRPGADRAVIVHGSSYGGTVSARIAMDFPELVDGLLLQSASMAPREEYIYWLSYPTSHWLLSWALPPSIKTANFEKLNHQQQLEDMATEWGNIDARTVIVHGTRDWLIYPRNAYYACNRLTNAEALVHHMVADGEHDLIYRVPDLLKQYLHTLLDETESN